MNGGNLTVQRDYTYDGNTQVDQDLLDKTGQQAFSAVIAWADVPQNIKDALIAIDGWTYDQILANEGMT